MASLKTLICLDIDGVVLKGNGGIPGAAEAINRLGQPGSNCHIIFCTNNSTRCREEVRDKLMSVGIDKHIADVPNIFTASRALAHTLLETMGVQGKVLFLGNKALEREINDHATSIHRDLELVHPPSGKPVVPNDLETLLCPEFLNSLQTDMQACVFGYPTDFSYVTLACGSICLSNPKVPLLITNPDKNFPSGKGLLLPGTGSLVAGLLSALECQSSVRPKPVICGKPEVAMGDQIKKSYTAERVIFVGDNIYTDILFGQQCGFETCLVLSGVTKTAEDASRIYGELGISPSNMMFKDIMEFSETLLAGKA